MIKGIGIDIVEIKTIEKSISRSKRFKERIYTANEIQYCEQKPFKFQHFAARFAAKEAVMKAMGIGWDKGIQWKQIEVLSEYNGKPIIRVSGKAKDFLGKMKLKNILLSLSHSKDYATAFVVIQ